MMFSDGDKVTGGNVYREYTRKDGKWVSTGGSATSPLSDILIATLLRVTVPSVRLDLSKTTKATTTRPVDKPLYTYIPKGE